MDLKEIDLIGSDIDGHWYYESKAKSLYSLINKIMVNELLDVGAGSGFFSKYLLKKTSAIKAVCIDVNYKKYSTEIFGNKKIEYKKNTYKSVANLVLMVDVLEHINNDSKFLKSYIAKVPSGTYFLISVPAFNFLWSQHDTFLGHKRRYTLKSLRNLVQNCELEIKSENYYFLLIMPVAIIYRFFGSKYLNKFNRKSDLIKHNFFVNYILTVICNIESKFMAINKFAGVSVFCLARKK